MMDNLTAYNTLGLNKDDLIHFALKVEKTRDFTTRFNGINIGMSSGTSGNKGIIITTKKRRELHQSNVCFKIGFTKNASLRDIWENI